MTAAPLVSVRDAVKRFALRNAGQRGGVMTALDHVDMTIRRGETLGIVGESGSGKSTLGRAILRLLNLDSGTIVFGGTEVQSLGHRDFRRFRARLQMVFQNPATSFNPAMTIEAALVDAMQLLPGLDGQAKRRRASKLLADVELSDRFLHLYPYEMSGGQLQRVAIARALAPEPDLIFLDEPTAALDMSVRGQIVNMLRRLQRDRSIGLVFVSHDLRVIRGVADRVTVMYLGQVVEEAPKRALFDRPLHPYTRALLSATQSVARPRDKLKGEAVFDGAPTGCRLVGRCPYAQPACAEPQPLREFAPGHLVRCWMADKLDLQAPTTPV